MRRITFSLSRYVPGVLGISILQAAASAPDDEAASAITKEIANVDAMKSTQHMPLQAVNATMTGRPVTCSL